MSADTTATPIGPVARAAALIGLLGQIVFTVGWLVAGALQGPRYSVARHDISDMGAIGAPHAWVLLVAQGFAGFATLAFLLLAFRPALIGARGRTLSTVLIALPIGFGNLSDAFFRLDCRAADGCAGEQAIQSWHAAIHAFGGLLLFVAAVAPYIVARCLRRSPWWASLARPSILVGVVLDILLVAGIALGTNYGAGYAQRAFALVATLWIALLAWRVVRLTGPDLPMTPTPERATAPR